MKVWENSKKLSKHSLVACVPTAFLILEKVENCSFPEIEMAYPIQYNTLFHISLLHVVVFFFFHY